MTRRAKKQTRQREAPPPAPPTPVNVVDGVPDVTGRRRAWKYVLIAIAFLAWVAFLAYCGLAGGCR